MFKIFQRSGIFRKKEGLFGQGAPSQVRPRVSMESVSKSVKETNPPALNDQHSPTTSDDSRGSQNDHPSPSVIIPAYFYPEETIWGKVIDTSSHSTVSIMIMNPNSGPGISPDETYISYVSKTRAVGIKVIGYVHTQYGQRSLETVQAEIAAFVNWYAVDGIFIDEVASGAQELPYYAAVAQCIRSYGPRNSFIVLNPGVYPHERYMQYGDIIVTFEGGCDSYLALQSPDWSRYYQPSRFCHIVHSVRSRTAATDVLERAKRRHNTGHVFVTDALMPNPYDRLPSYFDLMARAK